MLNLLFASCHAVWGLESVLALGATSHRLHVLGRAWLVQFINETNSITWQPFIMDEVLIAMKLRSLRMGDVGPDCVCLSQAANAHMCEYHFEGEDEEDGAHVIAPYLFTSRRTRRALAALYVTNLHNFYPSYLHDAAYMGENPSRVVADFKGCLLGDEGLRLVLRELAHHRDRLKISILDLSGTILSDEGILILADFLHPDPDSLMIPMPELHSLTISANAITDDGIAKLLNALVVGCYHVKDFDFRESCVSLSLFDSDAWCDFSELYGEPDSIRMCRQELIDGQELIADV